MESVQKPQGGALPALSFPAKALALSEKYLVGAHILVAFVALSIGIFLGPFQTFRRAPGWVDIFGGPFDIPIFSYYYQALTLHGVLNALVFTTFFIMGTSMFVVQRSLQRPLKSPQLAWGSFGMMLVGLVMAAIAILAGEANVLYTAYLPMQAHWMFYLGLALVIVGSWVGATNVFLTYMDWRKENDRPVPLAVYAVVANFVMWWTASLGVAIEVLFMALPLSLGWIDTTDVQVSRVLFWFFGHPLVYFWLIPAYLSWYTMLPKQLGVKLFSDAMGRVVFWMIMIFSIPIGVHHLFVDPGISESAKVMHSILTFVVAVPSFLTAFNIAATMERGGRKRGATGLLDWLWKQPWANPVVAAQFGGMILFVFGGITGLMNASFNLNVALHNTTWVVGHFHTTVAGAVFMTYVGIAYWLVPAIRGRKLWMPSLAIAQVFTWLGGMLIFGAAMGRAGMEGAVRRTDLGTLMARMQEITPDIANTPVGQGVLVQYEAHIHDATIGWFNWSAIAGVLLFISAALLFAVLLGTLFLSKKETDDQEFPIQTEAPTDEVIPGIFENWRLNMAIIVFSNVIMWGPVLMSALNLSLGFWVSGNPNPALTP